MRPARKTRIRRTAALMTAMVIVAGSLAFLSTGAAFGMLDDEVIPGKPYTFGTRDRLTLSHNSVVHRIYLLEGQSITFQLGGDGGTDFNLYLYPSWAEDFTTPAMMSSTNDGTSSETITFSPMFAGWYYLRVYRVSGDGWYSLSGLPHWPVPIAAPPPIRVSGADRYETAVAIAQHNFPDWRNVKHVVIASGEDRAAADPLSAAGLAWTYGAPVFLVRADSTPECVIEALQGIREQNGPFYLHIVGGPVSVGPGATADIEANVLNVIYDRVAPYGDRYTLAASIARRMAEERPDDMSGDTEMGGHKTALIANGEDPSKFFDALALAPVCGGTGWPILLVRKDSIPGPTAQVLSELDLSHRIIGGGPATVSEAVKAQLNVTAEGCQRISGADRYETAWAISSFFGHASIRTTDRANTGIAARLPDALTGGSFLGLRRGCILLTRTDSLPTCTRDFLRGSSDDIARPYVFGGPMSVDAGTLQDIDDALDPP